MSHGTDIRHGIHGCTMLLVACVAAMIMVMGTTDTVAAQAADITPPSFSAAQPVWPDGREEEMNLTVGFRAIFDRPAGDHTIFRVTGSSLYRIYLNGVFVGHGPARGPRDYYRVDEWELDRSLLRDDNVIAVEVAGYNINSYYLLDQLSFLQAEVVSDGAVLAATGDTGNPFQAVLPTDRNRRVERYSFQRMFMESYRLEPGYDAWRTARPGMVDTVKCAVQPTKLLLPRRVAYPRFRVRQPVMHISSGVMKKVPPPEEPWRVLRSRVIGPTMEGYYDNEIDHMPAVEFQEYATATRTPVDEPYHPESASKLSEMGYEIHDLGTNLTGFIGAEIRCDGPARLLITFDEILSNDDVDYKRYWCNNLVELDCAPGGYVFETIEPYTMRYVKIIVLEGECEIGNISLREYTTPDVWEAGFTAADPRLNDIFDAARETYRQNSVDIFMDCPSRERSGWLCDSFFTARVAPDLSGHADIEKNFLENFLLPESFRYMPEGMFPPCYPADQTEGRFIPNWALFLVLELEEYLARSGDSRLVDAFEPRIMKLFDYFADFENSDGLLENLESWVFVEWSEARNYVQDVSYPSNSLYAGALGAAGRLYGRPELLKKADDVRADIRKQSFDGTFFVDNAVRDGDRLGVTTNRTEVCQYYAFFFDVATPETHERLWERLLADFGPDRDDERVHPDISRANAFIGNYLRLELLSRAGRTSQVKDEIVKFFHPMSRITGTLWEHMAPQASCNHGFASHVAHCLYRDVLGLYRVDTVGRQVSLRFGDIGLDWCEGRMPTPDGTVSLRWRREGDTLAYDVDIPAGYTLTIENLSGLTLRAF